MVSYLNWVKPYIKKSPSCSVAFKVNAVALICLITAPITLPVIGMIYLHESVRDRVNAHRVKKQCKMFNDLMGLPEDAIQPKKKGEACVWLKWTIADESGTRPETTIAIVDKSYFNYGRVIERMIERDDNVGSRSNAYLLIHTDLSKLDENVLNKVLVNHISEIKAGDFIMLHRFSEKVLGDFGNMCIACPNGPLRKWYNCRQETF
jgi:hypothetical protein